MPPRTRYSPWSSTGSWRSYPASASSDDSASGSISAPVRTPSERATSIDGAVSRCRSAGAEATTTRADPVAIASSARARAELTRMCGVSAR